MFSELDSPLLKQLNDPLPRNSVINDRLLSVETLQTQKSELRTQVNSPALCTPQLLENRNLRLKSVVRQWTESYHPGMERICRCKRPKGAIEMRGRHQRP